MNTPTLPASLTLNVSALAGIFRTRQNSYKYLFFLALLEKVRKESGTKIEIAMVDLAIDMLRFAWYPHTYFRLSFGRQDMIGRTLTRLQSHGLPEPRSIGLGQSANTKLRKHIHIVYHSQDVKDVQKLLRYVPYRLLTSFFREDVARIPDQKKNHKLEAMASERFDTAFPLYKIERNPLRLIIHPAWISYLQTNHSIIHSWASWEWLVYMQSVNRNIPGVALKLFPPEVRESLKTQRDFWQKVLDAAGQDMKCPFSGQSLESFHLDHYLPWTFVVHNQLWNLVPASPLANESKGNCLPHADYFERFVKMQHQSITVSRDIMSLKQWETILESYLTDLLPSGKPEDLLDWNKLSEVYREQYGSLMTIARRQGFPAGWRFDR